jgi:hypothetical protein
MEGTAMQFVVWVETMIAGKSVAVQRAAVVERQCLANVPTKLGLTLQEGRAILTGIEQAVVQSQVELQSGAASVRERVRALPGSTAHQGYKKTAPRHGLWASYVVLPAFHSMYLSRRNAAFDMAPGIVGIARDEAIHARAYVSAR